MEMGHSLLPQRVVSRRLGAQRAGGGPADPAFVARSKAAGGMRPGGESAASCRVLEVEEEEEEGARRPARHLGQPSDGGDSCRSLDSPPPPPRTATFPRRQPGHRPAAATSAGSGTGSAGCRTPGGRFRFGDPTPRDSRGGGSQGANVPPRGVTWLEEGGGGGDCKPMLC